MCQPIKVMDYLESTGVIPRSLCSRIYYVSKAPIFVLLWMIIQEYRVPEDRNRALIDFVHSRAKHAYRPLIEALYLAGKLSFSMSSALIVRSRQRSSR